MNDPFDSRQLLAFATLARTGSFTQTARKMSLTQSAVSHSMKALEVNVGCRLLDRVGKKVMLTPAGEHLLNHAEVVLREMQMARDGLEQLGKSKRERLRVGATPSICATLLPRVLREFKEKFPNSLIQLEPGDGRELVLALLQQRIDLAITLQPGIDPRLEMLPLFGDELVFVVSPQHDWARMGVVSRGEIAQQNLMVNRRSSQTYRLIDQYFRKEGVVLDAVVELGSIEAIKELVKLNLGVSVLPPWLVAMEVENGTLQVLSLGRRKLRREWVVQHWLGRPLAKSEEAFVNISRSVAKQWPRYLKSPDEPGGV